MRVGDVKLGRYRVANVVAGAFALFVALGIGASAVGAFRASSGTVVSGTVEKGTITINEQGLAFVRGNRTVAVGSTVSWKNLDGASHTVTADDKSFDSGTRRTSQVYERKFAGLGKYTYFCRIHPFMKGAIVVVAPYGN